MQYGYGSIPVDVSNVGRWTPINLSQLFWAKFWCDFEPGGVWGQKTHPHMDLFSWLHGNLKSDEFRFGHIFPSTGSGQISELHGLSSKHLPIKSSQLFLVGGLVAIFYFPIYWVSNHPNWLLFFRGVAKNHQPVLSHHLPMAKAAFSLHKIPWFHPNLPSLPRRAPRSFLAAPPWAPSRKVTAESVGSWSKASMVVYTSHSKRASLMVNTYGDNDGKLWIMVVNYG